MARVGYWKVSFRSGESLRARERSREYAPASPAAADGQRACARGTWCSASRRGSDGTWHPAPAAQPLCPADRDLLVAYLAEIPPCYERLAALALDPVRSGLAIRVPPGSRVHVNPEADALMRLTADTAGAWAARVRAVPQLSLVPHDHLHGSLEQVREDCRVLALHPDPLLALAAGPMTRTWTFPPGRPGSRPPAPVPCRWCGVPLSLSPSGKHWWPAGCTHPAAVEVTVPYGDGEPLAAGWRCRLCADRLPAGWQPRQESACRHEPAALPVPDPGGLPGGIEDEIGDLDFVRGGDGWVTAWTSLSGEDAALEILDLRRRAVALLQENPAPPDLLDGIPCRRCDAMPSLEVIPAPPADPEQPEPAFCRCSAPGCRDEMTRKQYEDWTVQYRAWATSGGVAVCRRCQGGRCGDCTWGACACRSSGHAAALLANTAAGCNTDCQQHHCPRSAPRPGTAHLRAGEHDPCPPLRHAHHPRAGPRPRRQAVHDPLLAQPRLAGQAGS